MVKIQIDLPMSMDKFITIKKTILGLKDKRETILKIIKEDMDSYDKISLKEELKDN